MKGCQSSTGRQAHHDSEFRDRIGHNLLAVGVLILVTQPLVQLPEVLGRGRILYWSVSVAAFLLLVAAGLIGRPIPRPQPWRVMIALLLFHLVAWTAGHLVPLVPGTSPSGLEVSRVILSRHLLALEWSAIIVAAGWLCRPATSASAASGSGTRQTTTLFRITSNATVVLGSSLVAGLAFVLAGRGAGVGPVGASAAVLLIATGLATAAAGQLLESDPDA